MTTMNISLTAGLKNFIDEQVALGGYGSSSEYMRELLRKDQDRMQLRAMIIEGINSPDTGEMDEAYFKKLRQSVKKSGRK